MSIKVKIKDLNLYYSDFQALKGINLDIYSKNVTAFIGPSGCGKSTCLKAINRMNDLIPSCKTSGSILIDDENIYDSRTNLAILRKRAGMVFQRPNPFPMSVYDNIAYGLRVHGIKNKETINNIVEKSLRDSALWNDVKDRLKKSALGLSGGQQQRLCIARALAIEPDIVLMDEPTSALDPVSTLKIEDLIENLRKNYTVVIVTHNMQQAARISDSTAFFLNGEIVEYDKTMNIFNNPKDKRTEEYITGRFG